MEACYEASLREATGRAESPFTIGVTRGCIDIGQFDSPAPIHKPYDYGPHRTEPTD